VAIDRIVFGAGIQASDVTALRSGVDMVFKVGEGADQVTVKNWFPAPLTRTRSSVWSSPMDDVALRQLATRAFAATGTGHESLAWIDTWTSNPARYGNSSRCPMGKYGSKKRSRT